MDRKFSWYCEPPEWTSKPERLSVVTGLKTDFWQSTFYGFQRDNGHFYQTEVEGDFSAEVVIHGHYEELYDQAGLMLRVDAHNWIKTGIEFTDGIQHFSTVITRDGFSDWSVIPLGVRVEPIRLRLTRHSEALRIQYHQEGQWQMARLGYLSMPLSVMVGPLCCSPERAGLKVDFDNLVIGPPIDRALHGE
ncbi:MAG: DUF1349 domain-containing protein [Deltaproteobacteria bacterium]